ncbi:MAG: class I SAM-dependent methyltransferase [Cyanobacteriota bacterium]|jgi:SAM-dependent methyltransferase
MSANWYTEAATKIRDPRFLFMNHGYWQPDLEAQSGEPGSYAHQLSEALVRKVLGDLPRAGDHVLDVGCGRGGACALLARDSEAEVIIGMDRCAEGIETCRANVCNDRVTFVVGDAQSPPFADGRFHRVLNIESAHGYPNRLGFFKEVHRLLRPGGCFNYTDGVPPDTLDQQLADLKSAGLFVETVEDITAGVIEALERSSADRQALYDLMVAASTVDEPFARRLCNALTESIPETYRQGTLKYIVWRCHKPGDS